MNTKKFRTKTEFLKRDNGKIEGIWEIGIDIGYSSVKLFSPNITACFPSYAKQIDNSFQFAGETPANTIIYRNDENGELWLVGEVAQNTIARGDTSDSESMLYGRERYTAPMFEVITRTGLGISCRANEICKYDTEKIVVQTGLPERYMGDAPDLKDVLAGCHNFSIKIGNGEWETFSLNIASEDVYVMSQPKGTLFSVCVDKNRTFRKDAAMYLKSSVLVFDPGFGTLDLFPINSGVVGIGETFADLGMKRVFGETSRLIRDKYRVDIPVPAMQKNLESGTVRYFDRKTLQSKDYEFGDLLAQANEKVCNLAIDKMTSAANLGDYDYLIVTGGTGAAWYQKMQEKFKGISTLSIIPGNQNEDLSFIYSNVRGYYLYRYITLNKEHGKVG